MGHAGSGGRGEVADGHRAGGGRLDQDVPIGACIARRLRVRRRDRLIAGRLQVCGECVRAMISGCKGVIGGQDRLRIAAREVDRPRVPGIRRLVSVLRGDCEAACNARSSGRREAAQVQAGSRHGVKGPQFSAMHPVIGREKQRPVRVGEGLVLGRSLRPDQHAGRRTRVARVRHGALHEPGHVRCECEVGPCRRVLRHVRAPLRRDVSGGRDGQVVLGRLEARREVAVRIRREVLIRLVDPDVGAADRRPRAGGDVAGERAVVQLHDDPVEDFVEVPELVEGNVVGAFGQAEFERPVRFRRRERTQLLGRHLDVAERQA